MPKTQKMTPFGHRVRVRLLEMNMTQLELCKQIDCHPNYLSRILDGTRSGQKYMEAIYRVLGLPEDESR